MDRQTRILWIAIAAVALLVVVLWLQPALEEELAPELRRAWVGIEVAASGTAEVGVVELAAGTPFTLHAVLEAVGRGGRPVYYTRAARLRIAGREVPADQLRVWDRPPAVKVRWFTVEGSTPSLHLDAERGLGSFRLEPFFRADWPSEWAIPGEVDAANDDQLARGSALPQQSFGIQRYQVRIELYGVTETLVPERKVSSPGAADLPADAASFPTVVATLPGRLGPASAVFGLTQIDLPPDAGAELVHAVRQLADERLAFSRSTVLRDQIRGAGEGLTELTWRSVDLTGGATWGEGLEPGDLLRAADRVVVLYRDDGVPGVLDYGDLCFDYVRGAAVRALGDVFSGEGEAVELAHLADAG